MSFKHQILQLVIRCSLLSLLHTSAAAADDSTETLRGFGVGYEAFRDQLNVGLVYHGVELTGRLGQRIAVADDQLQWDMKLGLGASWSHGMTAFDLQARPLDVGYVLRVISSRWRLWIGPGLSANYHWYINPELQSGSFFWHTHYDLEARATVAAPIEGQQVRFELRVAALSLASRPSAHPDPYFYSWSFSDLVSNAHRHMVVGTVGRTTYASFATEWFIAGGDLSLDYVFIYEGYAPAPALVALQHLVRLTWH